VADSIRFYFDEHVPWAVAHGLRQRGVDILTIQEAGRAGLPDQDQLAIATADGRVLMTHDPDFLQLAATGIDHAGIAFCYATKYRRARFSRHF
jgi:predicted nuclease of predicted toxin-antitoxin system